jgi:hypothetical protein
MSLFSLCISRLSIKHHSPTSLQTSRLFQAIQKSYVPIMYIIMVMRPSSIAGRSRKSLLESVQTRFGAHSLSFHRMWKSHCLRVKRPECEADESPHLLPMLKMSGAMTAHPTHFYGVHRDIFKFSCILILCYLFTLAVSETPPSTYPAAGFYQWDASHLLRFSGNCFRNSRSYISLTSLKLGLPLRAFRS